MAKGRPSKYESHVEPFLSEIAEMATRMTEAQIADSLGVSYTQFREMKKKYPSLSDSLKRGRKTVVERGRSALIMKAEGFEHDERKSFPQAFQDECHIIILLNGCGSKPILISRKQNSISEFFFILM